MIYNDNFKNVIEYFLYEIICKYKENRNVAIIKDWFKEFFIKGFNNIFVVDDGSVKIIDATFDILFAPYSNQKFLI